MRCSRKKAETKSRGVDKFVVSVCLSLKTVAGAWYWGEINYGFTGIDQVVNIYFGNLLSM